MNICQLFLLLCLSVLPAAGVFADIDALVGLSGRYFTEEPAYEDQERNSYSIVAEGEARYKFNEGLSIFTFAPFYREDSADEARSHGDIRKLSYFQELQNWQFEVGIGKVFWGVTESAHLVDIINQTDYVEDFYQEEKLGQPLLSLKHLHDGGAVAIYLLPYFRERTFIGSEGRLRPSIPIDDESASYESDRENHHLDYAIRLQHSFNSIDLGLSYFDGTAREPTLQFDNNTMQLTPYYPQMKQVGLEFLYIASDWLWKLENKYVTSEEKEYNAAVGGVEYTMYRWWGTGVDLGLFIEMHYDSRGEVVEAPFQNDAFIGLRFNFNNIYDTELMFTNYTDLDNQSKLYGIEFSSRFGDRFKIIAEMLVLSDADELDTFYEIRQDDYVELGINVYF